MSLESSKDQFESRLRRVVELTEMAKKFVSPEFFNAVDCLNDDYQNMLNLEIGNMWMDVESFSRQAVVSANEIARLERGIKILQDAMECHVCDNCELMFDPDTSDGCTVNDETTQCAKCVSEATEAAR